MTEAEDIEAFLAEEESLEDDGIEDVLAEESPEAEGMLASRLSRQSLANMRPDVVNLVNYSSHAFPNA